MASSSKGVEVRPYLDPLEELHALVDRYDLSRKRKAAVQSPSRPLGLASPEAWMAAAILGPAKGANTSPLPPPPPPPASIFKPLSQSVYAPPHTLPHRDPNRIAASSRPRTNGNKQQQQQQQQQQRWQQQRQPFAPMSMIREEKKWKEPEQAPVAAVVPTSTTIVQKPKQMKQHAPPTTITTARTTMVQKPKQTNQQAPVAVVAPTSTTTITTTTTTTMVQKPKQTKQQAPPPPQQQPQRVWNGNGWTEPAGTRDPEDARKEGMRLAFRHILRF